MEQNPILDKYQNHWENLLGEVHTTPKLPKYIYLIAIGYALVGIVYGIGLILLSPLFIPWMFGYHCFREMELPWKLKDG